MRSSTRRQLARVGTKHKNILNLSGVMDSTVNTVDLIVGTDTSSVIGDQNTTPVLNGGRVAMVDVQIDLAGQYPLNAGTNNYENMIFGMYFLWNPNGAISSFTLPTSSLLTNATYKNNILWRTYGFANSLGYRQVNNSACGEPARYRFRLKIPTSAIRNGDKLQLVYNQKNAQTDVYIWWTISVTTIWYV